MKDERKYALAEAHRLAEAVYEVDPDEDVIQRIHDVEKRMEKIERSHTDLALAIMHLARGR